MSSPIIWAQTVPSAKKGLEWSVQHFADWMPFLTSNQWCSQGLNTRPRDCEASALTPTPQSTWHIEFNFPRNIDFLGGHDLAPKNLVPRQRRFIPPRGDNIISLGNLLTP